MKDKIKTNDDLKVVWVDIESLRHAEYNPRKWSEKEEKQLEESIRRFGVVDPLIVNSHPSRYNVVIGGNFRLEVLKKLGYKKVPVVYVNIADIEKEKELNLRLNRNTGEWDWDRLAREFDIELLQDVGFDEKEISLLIPEEDIKYIDFDALRKTYSVVIKCKSKEEQETVMKLLNIKRPSVKFEDFINAFKEL